MMKIIVLLCVSFLFFSCGIEVNEEKNIEVNEEKNIEVNEEKNIEVNEEKIDIEIIREAEKANNMDNETYSSYLDTKNNESFVGIGIDKKYTLNNTLVLLKKDLDDIEVNKSIELNIEEIVKDFKYDPNFNHEDDERGGLKASVTYRKEHLEDIMNACYQAGEKISEGEMELMNCFLNGDMSIYTHILENDIKSLDVTDKIKSFFKYDEDYGLFYSIMYIADRVSKEKYIELTNKYIVDISPKDGERIYKMAESYNDVDIRATFIVDALLGKIDNEGNYCNSKIFTFGLK